MGGNICNRKPAEPIDELHFPSGIELLQAWQSRDERAGDRLRTILDKAIAGHYDELFSVPPPENQVHACGPVDLLTLTVMFRLYGTTTEMFYKQDAERFIRSSLIMQRLLGMQKHYISWPVYAFTAEALGQTMIYSDQYSPGTDPDDLRFDQENWWEVETPDLDSGIPGLLDQYVDCFHRLTGQHPVLHLSAPYSLAADTFGQEAIIGALTHEPDFVNQFLDLLADRVLQPWMERFFQRYPQGWVELSDASGSPFFIGPQNCRDMAIRASLRLKKANPWGNRVYNANYRGDYVTCAERPVKNRARRGRKRTGSAAGMSLQALFEAKDSVCPDYVIRLAEDRVPVEFYETQAIDTRKPLFIGIGATQIDRNSIADLTLHKRETETLTRGYVESIKRVAIEIAQKGYGSRQPPWPGNIYFEDISAESSFELIRIIIATVVDHGGFTLRCE
ncbi:MAG: hypothetical protein GY935_02270 [Gammaproteobacteria bacterium]|nr:hypothetical protein [Gammaproteobacteria bacterium]